jgi:hypothetical protein
MKLGIVGVIVVVVGGLAGCGKGQVAVHSRVARQIPPPIASSCASDWKTLETASEAYFANTGAYPADQVALVDAGLIYAATADFQYSATDGNYLLTGVGDCVGFEPS